MEIRSRLREADRVPTVWVVLVISTPVMWLTAFGIHWLFPWGAWLGEAYGVDTAFHVLALGVAVRHGTKNRRWAGMIVAILSPALFVLLVVLGPWEDTGGWIPSLPTIANVVVAYVAANLVLALGLMLTAAPSDRISPDQGHSSSMPQSPPESPSPDQ